MPKVSLTDQAVAIERSCQNLSALIDRRSEISAEQRRDVWPEAMMNGLRSHLVELRAAHKTLLWMAENSDQLLSLWKAHKDAA